MPSGRLKEGEAKMPIQFFFLSGSAVQWQTTMAPGLTSRRLMGFSLWTEPKTLRWGPLPVETNQACYFWRRKRTKRPAAAPQKHARGRYRVAQLAATAREGHVWWPIRRLESRLPPVASPELWAWGRCRRARCHQAPAGTQAGKKGEGI